MDAQITKPGLIYKKISDVMKEVESISKDSTNQAQGFKYRSIDSVYNVLNPILAKHGVFTVPNVLKVTREERQSKSGSVLNYTILEVMFAFFAEDGSNVCAKVVGEGMDSGDKSSNKAMSVAHKYAYLQVFSIPTEDEKDPDAQSWDAAQVGAAHSDPGSYVIQISKKYKGRTLYDVGIDEAMSFKNWLLDTAKKDNKPLGNAAAEYCNAVDLYAQQITDRAWAATEDDVL